MASESMTLVGQLGELDEQLRLIASEVATADGHLLHEWSARANAAGASLWAGELPERGAVPVWQRNVPMVTEFLRLLAVELEAIEDARVGGRSVREAVARDHAYIYCVAAQAAARRARTRLVEADALRA